PRRRRRHARRRRLLRPVPLGDPRRPERSAAHARGAGGDPAPDDGPAPRRDGLNQRTPTRTQTPWQAAPVAAGPSPQATWSAFDAASGFTRKANPPPPNGEPFAPQLLPTGASTAQVWDPVP